MELYLIAILLASFAAHEVASFNCSLTVETVSRSQTFAGVPTIPGNLWPGATVYYSIDANFDAQARQNLQFAINDFHAKTCIRWVPRTSQPGYVHLRRRSGGGAEAHGCYSGGLQYASFGEGPVDASVGVLIHEMSHSVCLLHEHDRYDRDQYLLQGIGCSPKYTHLNGGHLYDYMSIVHYPCDGNCRRPRLPGVTNCTTISEMSVLDAEKLNDMYNCPGRLGYRFRFPELIPANGNPFQAGMDGNLIVYPCRGYANGHIVPGKGILSPSPACWVPSGGREVGMSSGFEILTNPGTGRMRWVTRTTGIFSNTVAGGRTVNSEPLYIARCAHKVGAGSIYIPGYVAKNSPNVMKYSNGGLEYQCASNYEFLVCED